MVYTQKVIEQSNHCYNDGLRRANIRDLTGAIISLKRSLQYCRQNIAARNLLGLVYYGRGEVNEALVEWIISKNLKPTDNVANYFIKKVQATPEDLEKINVNIKKYNQCIQSCHQDAEDIALIQLKKVVLAHPDFVSAHQLLALLCIRKEQFERARQALTKAQRLDTTDPVTLYYLNELPAKKHKKEQKTREEKVAYKVGNDTIIQPTTYSGIKENSSTVTIINIVTGILIGAAVVGFLINPAINQKENMRNADAIREYGAAIDAQKAQINALTTELDSYRFAQEEVEADIEAALNTKGSYESLYAANQLWLEEEASSTKIINLLIEVDKSTLGEDGLSLYETMYEEILVPRLESQYATGEAKFNVKDNENAIKALLEVIKIEPSYEDYYGMLMLALTYEEIDELDNALIYLEIIEADGDKSPHVNTAVKKIAAIKERIEKENTTSEG